MNKNEEKQELREMCEKEEKKIRRTNFEKAAWRIIKKREKSCEKKNYEKYEGRISWRIKVRMW